MSVLLEDECRVHDKTNIKGHNVERARAGSGERLPGPLVGAPVRKRRSLVWYVAIASQRYDKCEPTGIRFASTMCQWSLVTSRLTSFFDVNDRIFFYDDSTRSLHFDFDLIQCRICEAAVQLTSLCKRQSRVRYSLGLRKVILMST
eukprot:scaffold3304_cov154-Amphora_coffeaeformis.AAC.1